MRGSTERPESDLARLVLARHGASLGGRYEIQRELGAGGMATVYLATDHKLRRSVAIKVLREELTSGIESQRFLREIEIVAGLQHPHILPLFDSGELGETLYYVMPYVAGETLRDRLSRERQLLFSDVVAIVRDIAGALAYAHGRNILHRDIKPDNILLANGHALLSDFGIARALGRAAAACSSDTLTQAGRALGTPAYMSPEQIAGERDLDARSDIYSLGCVVYEVLAGLVPFPGVAWGLRFTEVPPPISRARPDIPASVENILARALAPVPSDRWETACEFADALAASAQTDAHPGRGSSVTTASSRSGHVTVGRDEERAELRACFERVNAGDGMVLAVAGEPGIGKTTVAEDYLFELVSSGKPCFIARGRCSERLAGAEAYLPLLEALESLLRDDRDGTIARAMKQTAPTWYAQVAQATGEPEGVSRAVEQLPAPSQERLKRELSTLLQEISRAKPLVAFLDDVHWADASTIDMLAYVASRFDTMRVLIIATMRPSEMLLVRHPFVALKLDLQSRGLCREIRLGFLSRADVERYLALQFPGHRFPDAFPELIHAKTEGSPLFMVDLVRYLRDRGLIQREEGRDALTGSLRDIDRDLPESVRSMIERKIGQLDPEDRRLLGVASVQGYEFDSGAVARAAHMDDIEVEERLATLELVHAFVHRVCEQEFPNGAHAMRYRFVHVFYQNTLFAALAPARKAALSAAIADTLLDLYGEESGSIAHELAVLFETARDARHASEHYLRAAKSAVRVFANEEAITLARRGLALLSNLPESPWRAQHELALNLTLGYPLMAVKGYAASDVQQAFDRARQLSEQLGEESAVSPALWGLWGFYFIRGDLRTARDLATQLVRLAEAASDTGLLVQARVAMGMTLTILGELHAALEQLESGLMIYDSRAHRSHILRYGHDPGVICHSQSMLVLWLLGFPSRALESSRQALVLADEIGHPQSRAFARHFTSFLRELRREPDAALEQAEVVHAIAEEFSLLNWKAWSMIMRGWAKAQRGSGPESVAEIRQGLAIHERMGAGVSVVHFLLMMSEALERTGEYDEAMVALDEGLGVADRTGERYLESELHRLRGEVTLRRAGIGVKTAAGTLTPETSQAVASIRRAVGIAREQGARSLELRALTTLCELQADTSVNEANRLELRTVYDSFTEGFETRDLLRANEVLALR